MSQASDVGGRLRQLRRRQGLSLQDVERRSAGRFKAAVVGSWERGDRNISASRLCELTEFYGVTAADAFATPVAAAPPPRAPGLVVDLQKLLDCGPAFDSVRSYVASVRQQRGDHDGRMLSVRGDDVRAMAIMMGTTPEGLVEVLRKTDVLVA